MVGHPFKNLDSRRRTFLLGGLGIIGVSIFGQRFGGKSNPLSSYFTTDQPWGSVCTSPRQPPVIHSLGYEEAQKDFASRIIFFRNEEVWSVDIPIQGHVVEQNPQKPDQLIVLNRRGPLGAEIHFGSRKVTNVFSAKEGRFFLGHCIFPPGGETYILTEVSMGDRQSYLVHRSLVDHKIVHESAIAEFFPHQLLLDPSGEKVWIPSFGSPEKDQSILLDTDFNPVLPHVSLRNIQTNQVEQSIVFVSYPLANRLIAYEGATMKVIRDFQLPWPSALRLMPNGDLWVGSDARPSNVSIIRNMEVIGGFYLDVRSDEKLGAHFTFLENV